MKKWAELRDYLIQKAIQETAGGDVVAVYEKILSKMDELDFKHHKSQ